MGADLVVAAVDMDDTLLGTGGSLSAFTQGVLQAWLDSGRRLVVATGRPPRSIGEILPPFLHGEPWICYNGAEIRTGGEIIYQDYIPEGALAHLVAEVLARHPEAVVGFEFDDMLYLNRPRSSRFDRTHRVVDLATVTHNASPKVLFFAEELAGLVESLHPLPAGMRLIAPGRYYFLQLMSSSADKVHALKFLVESWGLTLDNVIAFGDDVNDTEMLRAARVGVAMGNAMPDVQAAADRVAPGNDEDGVAVVLAEILARDDGAPPAVLPPRSPAAHAASAGGVPATVD
jgi:Cof subfamily protein (haloacid dehalogenase superfamily)